MQDETLVAVFDTPAHAGLAVADLRQGGIHNAAITGQEGRDPPEPRPKGFWATLFGAEPQHGPALYDHLVANGATVVTVTVSSARLDEAIEILQSHDPVDIDARAAALSLTGPPGANAGTPHVRRYGAG